MFRSPKPWWKMTDEERANLHREPAPPKPISLVELATRIVIGSGLDLALAASFLITWLHPYTFGEFAVKHFTLLMLLEFLVVHATGFMGALTSRSMGLFERILIFSLLFLFYIGMAFGMSVGMGSYWPALGFGLMLLGKLPTILRPQHEDDAMMGIMANWAAMVCLYLFGIFFVVTADIPPPRHHPRGHRLTEIRRRRRVPRKALHRHGLRHPLLHRPRPPQPHHPGPQLPRLAQARQVVHG